MWPTLKLHYIRSYWVIESLRSKRTTPLSFSSSCSCSSSSTLIFLRMDALSLSFIVGAVANFASMLIYFSPMLTFWRIVKKGSTEEFSGLPYVCTLQQAALWVYYGITKPGATLVAAGNSVGVVIEFIYVTLFLIYAPPRIRVKTGVLVAILNVGFLGVAVIVTHFAMQGNLRINVIGVLCAGPSILMYGSPLSIMVPNVIGLLLGMAQLILYAMYSDPRGAKSSIQGFEDGSQPLIQPVQVNQKMEV